MYIVAYTHNYIKKPQAFKEQITFNFIWSAMLFFTMLYNGYNIG